MAPKSLATKWSKETLGSSSQNNDMEHVVVSTDEINSAAVSSKSAKLKAASMLNSRVSRRRQATSSSWKADFLSPVKGPGSVGTVLTNRTLRSSAAADSLMKKTADKKSLSALNQRKPGIIEHSTRESSPEFQPPISSDSVNIPIAGSRTLRSRTKLTGTEIQQDQLLKKKQQRKRATKGVAALSAEKAKPSAPAVRRRTKNTNEEHAKEDGAGSFAAEKLFRSDKNKTVTPVEPLAVSGSEADSDSDGWEAVEENIIASDDESRPSTSLPLEITIARPEGPKRRGFDYTKYVLALLRRRLKETRTDIHEVHLISSLGRGFFLNDYIGWNRELLGIALSLWETGELKSKLLAKLDIDGLDRLVTLLKGQFSLKPNAAGVPKTNLTTVKECLSSRNCPSYLHLILTMLLMLRSIGLDVRLVYSMQPVPVKQAALAKTCKTKAKAPVKRKAKAKKSPASKASKGKSRVLSDDDSDSGMSESGSEKPVKIPANKRTSNRKRKLSSGSDSDFEVPEPVSKKSTSTVKTRKPTTVRESVEVATNKAAIIASKSPEKLTTTNEHHAVKAARGFGLDYWLEVYCIETKAYVPVHCVLGLVNQVEKCERTASQPVHYVVTFGGEKSAKEITAKYSTKWLTVNRKLQTSAAWWKDLLDNYKPKNKRRDQEEDDSIRDMLLARPRPKSLPEYKGHPLYVLQQHLTKYEAIYPPNPVPIDHVKEVPVFLRECVHLLHTRENWLREARSVKSGEAPYKEVKRVQRPKCGRRRNDANTNLMEAANEKKAPETSGLFGLWQTELYVPPHAENGKVPRNQYGNVELYQPSMLPGGCVHIRVKQLNKVAKKLKIDCVAAMTGWDFSGWLAHPVMDGWVVCEEYENMLLKAWEKEKVEIERKEVEQKAANVMNNWRKLIKGLLLKRKLQLKYGVDVYGNGHGATIKKKPETEISNE